MRLGLAAGQQDTCIFAAPQARFVGPAQTEAELWDLVYEHNEGPLEVKAFRCGVIVLDCKAILDIAQAESEEMRDQNRAVLRYELRHLVLMALNRALADGVHYNIDLPDLGTPDEEVRVRYYNFPSEDELFRTFAMFNDIDDREQLIFQTTEVRPNEPPPFSIDMLETAFSLSARIFRESPTRNLASILYESRIHQRQYLSTQSFILCWSVLEKCMTMIVDDHASRKPQTDRPSFKKKYNQTAASKAKYICAQGLISPEELTLIDSARRSRNAFMHDLKPINPKLLSNMLFLTARLMGAAVKFEPSFGITLRGIR